MNMAGGARPVDVRALARQRAALCRSAEAPWLHAEVARRMAERLQIIRSKPRRVLDWWAPLSGSRECLRSTCPQAEIVEVWPSGIALPSSAVRPAWQRWFWRQPVAATVVADAAVAPASAQMLWSNMGLHGCEDPPAMFARWRQALAVDGFLMFSTLGPGTLVPLRSLFAEFAWGPPMAPLVDMHDLGDMLVAAGFAEPVMDQETLHLHWADAASLLAELRSLGGNSHPQRGAGLRTPRWKQRLVSLLDDQRGADGRISMPFEIVYGHAMNAPPRVAVAAETRIGAEQLRTMARRRRTS